MKKPRAYEPVRGPQQRRRLLRGVAVPRKSREVPSYSYSDARKLAAKMLGFEPLTPLSRERLSLLKQLAIEKTLHELESNSTEARGLLYGVERGHYYGIGNETRRAERKEVIGLFTDAKKERTTTVSLINLRSGVQADRSLETNRGLQDYADDVGIDVVKHAKEVRSAQGRKIRFLDVGHHTGRVASELKSEMGAEVETHTLSPLDHARYPGVDAYHMLYAECLPKEFRRHFDLVVSSRALEYSLFPDSAIRNIAESLAPGGRAVIQWRSGRFVRHDSNKGLFFYPPAEKYQAPFKGIKLTPAGRKVMQESIDAFKVNITIDELLWRFDPLKQFFKEQAIAWCNELGRLRADPDLTVRFEDYGSDMGGFTPYRVFIERKR
ncbi:MAG: methyltransferase domain-containing protein [Candidatus Diapherotrites archaeon]|nr:methyltransferase domain-containing protein [Candidatus Diapherotrites archaeon]